MPIIDGYTFPTASAPVEYSSEIDQDAFVSSGGTVHAWERRAQDLQRIKFTIHGLSQSDAAVLKDKHDNVARGSKNKITLRMDGEVSNREVHFWFGRRGLRLVKRRNDLWDASLTFLQVGGTDAVVG